MSSDEGGDTGGGFNAGGFDFGIGAFHDARMRNLAYKRHKKLLGWQWAREDSAIQRRVADARAAGVHPLFALGGSVQSGTSATLFNDGATNFDASRFGASLGALANSKLQAQREQETHDAAIAESDARRQYYEAKANDIEDMYQASQAARGIQESNYRQDQTKVSPDNMISSQSADPSVSAGKEHPAQREYTITRGGLKMDLPYSEEGPSEAFENVPLFMWPAVIAHNMNKYGSDWLNRFVQEYVYDRYPKWRPHPKEQKWIPGAGDYQDN